MFDRVFSLMGDSRVKMFVGDFEEGVWLAIKELQPHLKVHGCAFHFQQALYRYITGDNVGLQVRISYFIIIKSVHAYKVIYY